MSHETKCPKCGRAARFAGIGVAPCDGLCAACWAFEVRDARIRDALNAGRLADLRDLDAQVAHIERENAAIVAVLEGSHA
jgi:hypothetical protein